MNQIANDSIAAINGGMGTDRDKSSGVYFGDTLIPDDQLIAAYEGNWIAANIINIPAEDALRKWRSWNSDKAEQLIAAEKKLGFKKKLLDTYKKGRLFGGAALYIGTGGDPSEPLEPSKIGIGGIKHLTVLTRRELQVTALEQDPQSGYYGKPINYQMAGIQGHLEIHPSRLIVFNGVENADPWIARGTSYGWGKSSLVSVAETIKQASSTHANIASLIFEANVDVVGVPDLMDIVGDDDGRESLLKRFSLAAIGKGIHGMLVLDKNEEYNRRSASFANLPETMEVFALYCASGARIPATKFLGRSPSGLTATGEHDQQNYFDLLSGMQELDIEPACRIFDDCLKAHVGASPDDSFDWQPLKQLSDLEISELGKKTLEALKILHEMNLVTPDAMLKLTTHRLAEIKAFPHIEQAIGDMSAAQSITVPKEPEELED